MPYRLGLGILLARKVMILTTRGRATGRSRKTPLWYVRTENVIYCLSGWGPTSDWWKNMEAYPYATIQVGKETWKARGDFIPGASNVEEVLGKFRGKYGHRTLSMFYHLDRLVLVAFPLDGSSERRE